MKDDLEKRLIVIAEIKKALERIAKGIGYQLWFSNVDIELQGKVIKIKGNLKRTNKT